MRLRECGRCALIWADAHLDPTIISAHFEEVYKGREYFMTSRAAIFRSLAAIVCESTPFGGRVLDIGGAQGDLLYTIESLRPDLRVVLHDISQRSTDFARKEYDLGVICGDISALAEADGTFDTVILSDVLYYEPQLRLAWEAVERLVAPGGMVLIRVPNKLPIIRCAAMLTRICALFRPGRQPDDIPYFNPEHIYILSRSYLENRLRQSGFTAPQAHPTPLLNSQATRLGAVVGGLCYLAARWLAWISRGWIIATPGMVVVARRAGHRRSVAVLREWFRNRPMVRQP